MKRMKLVVLAIALVSILAAGNALAQGSATVTVSATVEGTCIFAAGPYAMSFGTIDPTNATPDSASATLTFTCTNGTAYTLENVSGDYTFDTGPGTLAFNIAPYTLSGDGTGSSQTLTLDGSISAAQKANAEAGSYTHSLVININP